MDINTSLCYQSQIIISSSDSSSNFRFYVNCSININLWMTNRHLELSLSVTQAVSSTVLLGSSLPLLSPHFTKRHHHLIKDTGHRLLLTWSHILHKQESWTLCPKLALTLSTLLSFWKMFAFYLSIYLFLAVLSLRFCTGFCPLVVSKDHSGCRTPASRCRGFSC